MTTTLERKTLHAFGVKVLDKAQGIVEMYVAGIGNVDETADRFLPGAFTKGFAEVNPKGVWGHDWLTPVGKTLEKREVAVGDAALPAKLKAMSAGAVYIKGQFNLATSRGSDAFADVQFFGDEQEWSVGWEDKDSKRDPNTGVRDIAEAVIWEWSPVLFGANRATATASVKSLEGTGQPIATRTKQAFAGSYEQRTEQLTEALLDAIPEVDYLYIIGTWDNQCCFRVYYKQDNAAGKDYREPETFMISYTLANGAFTFGDPQAVDLVLTIVPDADAAADATAGGDGSLLAGKILVIGDKTFTVKAKGEKSVPAPGAPAKTEGKAKPIDVDPEMPHGYEEKDGECLVCERTQKNWRHNVGDETKAAELALEALERAPKLLATKGGKVQAARNEERLRTAYAKLGEILAELDDKSEESDTKTLQAKGINAGLLLEFEHLKTAVG